MGNPAEPDAGVYGLRFSSIAFIKSGGWPATVVLIATLVQRIEGQQARLPPLSWISTDRRAVS